MRKSPQKTEANERYADAVRTRNFAMSKRRYPIFEFPPRTASKTLATRKYVKRCMRNQLEKKSLPIQNFVGTSGVPGTAGQVDPLQSFNIRQGTTDDDRTGNFVRRTRLTVRMLANTVADTLAPVMFRVIFFYDKQTNGATPAVADVITSGTGGMLAGYNPNNVLGYGGTRFRILKDSFFVINPDTVVDASNTLARGRVWTWVWHGAKLGTIQFDADAGAITDIVSGEINVLTISDSATAVIQGSSQMQFVDS